MSQESNLDKVVIIGNNQSVEQYLETRQKDVQAKLDDPNTSELTRQQLARDLHSSQRFAEALKASNLDCHLNLDTLLDCLKKEPDFSVEQDDAGNIRCSYKGDTCRPETLIHRFSDSHPTLFRESYSQLAHKVYRSKEDFETEKQKSDYIMRFGFEQYANLPLRPEKEPSIDEMTAEQYKRLPQSRKNEIISQVHLSGVRTILARRQSSAAEIAGVKQFSPRPIVNKRAGIIVYKDRESK